MQGEFVEEVAQRYPARFVPGGQVVLQLGGDLQFLRVGEGVLEGGLVHLVVYYWSRRGNVLLVGEFGRAGFLGGFGECEGPVFDIAGGFLHVFGLDDGDEILHDGLEARELTRPEVGPPSLVRDEELSSGRDVLREVGSVLQTEHESGDEVHGDCMAQSEHFDWLLVRDG